jgi:hypothetical protein
MQQLGGGGADSRSNNIKISELKFLSYGEIMLLSTTKERNLNQNQLCLLACIAHSCNLTRYFSPLCKRTKAPCMYHGTLRHIS